MQAFLKLILFFAAIFSLSACSAFGFGGCSKTTSRDVAMKQTSFSQKTPGGLEIPLGLFSAPFIPENNQITLEKVHLGRLLYFDPRLSADGTVSCATCHHPDKGWTDQAPVSTGIKGQKGGRSAPTVINSAYMFSQFWDGRAATLEEQALGPLINPIEMGNRSHQEVIDRLKKISGYVALFKETFGRDIDQQGIALAIASFERTILGGNSRYDRYTQGDQTALNESEVRGKDLFFGKANCTRCHAGPNFSDSQFHNLGVGMKSAQPDWGRYDVTKNEADKGAFKTPTVRDITKTAPYMHDGSEKALEDVMVFYNKGGERNPWIDVRMEPLNLTDQEMADVVAFMKALDSDPYPYVEEPTDFPK